MKLKYCRQCREKFYESFRSYGSCHNCQFNSVDETVWLRFEMRHARFAGTPKDPLRTMREDLGKPPETLESLKISLDQLQKILWNFGETHRQVLYLVLWKKMDPLNIGYLLDLGMGLVERHIQVGMSWIEQAREANERDQSAQCGLPRNSLALAA
jgi:hypothetical protein